MWLGRAYAKATVFTIDNPAAAVRIVYGVFLQTEPTGKEEATPVRDDINVSARACRTGAWSLPA